MRKINGEWHMGVDEGIGESIHVHCLYCSDCKKTFPMPEGTRLPIGTELACPECGPRAKNEEGGRDDE